MSSVSPGPRKSLFDSNKQKVSPRPSVVCTRQSKIIISPKLLREKKRTRINWPHKEDVALVQFVALHKDLQASTIEWPQPSPESDYWDKAADYIQQVAGTPYRRQGSSVRKRVADHMKKKWDTVDEAEEDLGLSVDSYLGFGDTFTRQDEDTVSRTPKDVMGMLKHLTETQLTALIVKASSMINNKQSLLHELLKEVVSVKLLSDMVLIIHKRLSR